MKLIILVGFSKGLGKAIYEQLLPTLIPGKRELLALGRNKKNNIYHDCVTHLEADLLISNCWDKIHIPKKTKSIDVIFNAAVIEPIGTVGAIESDQVESAVKVNYISPMTLVNTLMEQQKKSNFELKLNNITSGASSKAIEGWALYCSTKAAFKMFLDVVCLESGNNVSIRHINPGLIDTDMQKAIRSKTEKEMKNVHNFIKLKKSNSLKSPYEVGKNVLEEAGLI
jgi:benzil reductase ((S)-benzoin forming)